MAITNKVSYLKVSIDGPFAQPASCFPVTSTKKLRTTYCKQLDLFVGDGPMGERVLALQTMRGRNGERKVYMDVVTGTLYRTDDGRCLSSDSLFVRDVRRSPSSVKALIENRRKSYHEHQF